MRYLIPLESAIALPRHPDPAVQWMGAERPALARSIGRAAFMPDRSSGLLDGAPPRYSARMKLSIEQSAAQGEQLRREAERLGVSPEELAGAVVADVLAAPAEDFTAAAARVMQGNRELYRRLA
jgi:hypothetical protein